MTINIYVSKNPQLLQCTKCWRTSVNHRTENMIIKLSNTVLQHH